MTSPDKLLTQGCWTAVLIWMWLVGKREHFLLFGYDSFTVFCIYHNCHLATIWHGARSVRYAFKKMNMLIFFIERSDAPRIMLNRSCDTRISWYADICLHGEWSCSKMRVSCQCRTSKIISSRSHEWFNWLVSPSYCGYWVPTVWRNLFGGSVIIVSQSAN